MKYILILLIVLITFQCQQTEESDLVRKKTSSNKSITKKNKSTKSDDPILIYSIIGEWVINSGTKEKPKYTEDFASYEIFYTESTNSYELKMEGYQPKNHSAYEDISKLIIKINNCVIDGLSYKQIRDLYFR